MLNLLFACTAPDVLPTSPNGPIHLAMLTATTVPGVSPNVAEESVPPAPTGFDLAEPLFSDDAIPAFALELSDDALDSLRSDPYLWVDGAMIYEGVRFDPVGIRLKGQNSFLPVDEKPSLKVKLNHAVEGWDLYQLEELTFDNMSTDLSMMHERVAYRLFREHGLPAARANHATLAINGEDRGLYTLVENVDEELLALWYPGDATGSMFEMADVDFVDADVDGFELESGVDDRTGLQALADALEPGGQAAYTAAADWVDWDQFVEYTAAAAVIGQFDSYPWRTPGDDAHLYFDPADGKLDALPHGMDETFSREDRDLFDAPGLLFQACLADPGCAADYEASLLDVQATADTFDLLAFAEEVQAEIATLVAADPARPYTEAEVDDGQAEMLDFIANRADQLDDQLGGP
jgi:hypothetical protein